MEYRTLGRSGLRVSLVGLGCNNFGRRIDYAASQPVVHKALDLGITLFDTADLYRSAMWLRGIPGPRARSAAQGHRAGNQGQHADGRQ
jgi:aryl-alcohol dehydrogenase-like predicted oxidoreductase